MIESLAGPQHFTPVRHRDTRALDTAIGVLVGWRRCSTQVAFRELISVSERHAVPVFALAAALVAVASGNADDAPVVGAAREAAEKEWGLRQLL